MRSCSALLRLVSRYSSFCCWRCIVTDCRRQFFCCGNFLPGSRGAQWTLFARVQFCVFNIRAFVSECCQTDVAPCASKDNGLATKRKIKQHIIITLLCKSLRRLGVLFLPHGGDGGPLSYPIPKLQNSRVLFGKLARSSSEVWSTCQGRRARLGREEHHKPVRA